ncbi:Mif2/CENP-C like-domain-containing protein [Polychytrium aggregatum]|uniref:Mif2/CENP-C like-domain-containing protein n=1 Tax=Polychytrium aggregatum TaxID=110093 RepID=UPI0022FF3C86|nr:Mif2/CENP-C like-domain-containing protein [Polychytrium aggregatum]KAI9204991.1 Mif2/CENP-C like-domain-containing protein [Polychytrium aggregatum]
MRASERISKPNLPKYADGKDPSEQSETNTGGVEEAAEPVRRSGRSRVAPAAIEPRVRSTSDRRRKTRMSDQPSSHETTDEGDDKDGNMDSALNGGPRKKQKHELPPAVEVLDPRSGESDFLRLFITSPMVAPEISGEGGYAFEKMFRYGDSAAAGVLVFPPGSEKPAKASRNNAMTFGVMRGQVRVTINEVTSDLGPGDIFVVPAGQQYRIVALSKADARIIFFSTAAPVEIRK